MNDDSQQQRPLLGVSACLLGQNVRFDGGHKHSKFVTESVAEHVKLVPVCPEMEMGLPAPRPAMQLRRQGEEVRLVVSRDQTQDLTGQMQTYAYDKVQTLDQLDGFIFKKDSPSCGVFRVPEVVNDQGYRKKQGTGLFAQAFIERHPLIPVEEEGRLNDAALRESFFERVYAYQRWKAIPNANRDVRGLMEFHARHKLLLMARGSNYYRELGRMIAGTKPADLEDRRSAYIHRFMQVMAITTRRGRQVDVLQHIMGYFKQVLSHEDKRELLSLFEAYRSSQVPLIAPVTLLQHHLRLHPQPYLGRQHYLRPCPEQLALRSYI